MGIDFGSQFPCKFVELTFEGARVHISCDEGYEPLSISKADFGSGMKFGDVSPPPRRLFKLNAPGLNMTAMICGNCWDFRI